MSIDAVLARGRAVALQLMRDTCLIERKDGAPVLDQATGLLVQAWLPVYAGVCRLKPQPPSESEFGEHQVTMLRFTAVLPWDASPVVRRLDRLTVTACDDVRLIGRSLEVIGVSLSGASTATRVVVEGKEG